MANGNGTTTKKFDPDTSPFKNLGLVYFTEKIYGEVLVLCEKRISVDSNNHYYTQGRGDIYPLKEGGEVLIKPEEGIISIPYDVTPKLKDLRYDLENIIKESKLQEVNK